MRSVTNFLSSFTETDIAKPSRFDVYIFPPRPIIAAAAGNGINELASMLSLRCEISQLPGRTFGTIDQKFGTNPIEKHISSSTYSDIAMTFIVSDHMLERNFFDAWMELAHPTNTFDFPYKDEYVSVMFVNQYDVYNQQSYSIQLNDVFPISIDAMDLNWNTDEFHKLTVTFAYTYWKLVDKVQLGNTTPLTEDEKAYAIHLDLLLLYHLLDNTL